MNKKTITMIFVLLFAFYWLIALGSQISWSVWAFFDENNRENCLVKKEINACRELIIDNKAWKEQMQELIKQIESENIEANKIIEGEITKTLSWTDFKLSFQ